MASVAPGPVGFTRFVSYLRQYAAVGTAVGFSIASLWLRFVPSYKIQREEITGVIIVLSMFELGYLYSLRRLVSRWVHGPLIRRHFSKEAVPPMLWLPGLILMILSLAFYSAYTTVLDASETVEKAKFLARQDQELSYEADDYLSRVLSEPPASEVIGLSRNYLSTRTSSTPTTAEILEGASSPIAFGPLLVFSSGLAVSFGLVGLSWLAAGEFVNDQASIPPDQSP